MMMGRPALVVIGHRGKGMNALASPDERLREVKENTVRSFNDAASVSGVAYVEFDVQVPTVRNPENSYTYVGMSCLAPKLTAR